MKRWTILLFLTSIALLPLLSLSQMKNATAASIGLHYVAVGGDCGGMSPCYADIQTAVSAAAPADEIRIAQGVYTGTHAVSLFNGQTVMTQVVFISQSVQLQGGYTITDWQTSDPAAHPTIVDAEGNGRVVSIIGGGAITIAGVSLTNGYAVLGGGLYAADGFDNAVQLTVRDSAIYSNTAERVGGGLSVHVEQGNIISNSITNNRTTDANALGGGGIEVGYVSSTDSYTISNNQIIGNQTASNGGGITFAQGGDPLPLTLTVSGNNIMSNTAVSGGGLFAYTISQLKILDNQISYNRSSQGGGVQFISSFDLTMANNRIQHNVVASGVDGSSFINGQGGGIAADLVVRLMMNNNVLSNNTAVSGGGLFGHTVSQLEIHDNQISDNHSSQGGGVQFINSVDVTMENNLIQNNVVESGVDGNPSANGQGGGIAADFVVRLMMNNNVLNDNTAVSGGGLFVSSDSSVWLNHNTIARNGDNAIFIAGRETPDSSYTRVTISNTAMISHGVGISVTGYDVSLEMGDTLWHNTPPPVFTPTAYEYLPTVLNGTGVTAPPTTVPPTDVPPTDVPPTDVPPNAPAFTQQAIDTNVHHGQHVNLVDLDEDGDNDIILSLSLDDSINLYLNDGSGGFTMSKIAPNDTIVTMETAVADIDNDGDLDVAAIGLFDRGPCGWGSGAFCEAPGVVVWYENPGSVTGSWTRHDIAANLWGTRTIAAADFTGNGRVDLLIGSVSLFGHEDGLYWIGQGTSGGWSAVHTIDITLGNVEAVLTADIDGDAVADAVAVNRDGNAVIWFENGRSSGSTDNNPAFTAHTIATPSAPYGIALANMDSDGALELLVTSDDGTAWYDSTANPTAAWTANPIDANFGTGLDSHPVAADFDGDGDMDVAVLSSSGASLRWYENDGSWTSRNISGYSGGTGFATGDMNGDGSPDLISTTYNNDSGTDRLDWWQN